MTPLFERFSSKENLKKAFIYLLDEIEKSSLPLDPIWKPATEAVSHIGKDYFQALQDYIRQGNYHPDKADYMFADKDNMGFRPICVFSIVDRIVYQALLNPWILGDLIDKKLFSSCYGNRMLGDKSYLKPYKEQWINFCDKQTEAFRKKFVWRVEFDIHTFYENIHPDILVKVLKDHFSVQEQDILELLNGQLKSWAENLTLCGLPQGANASHTLANAYLYPLDTLLDNLKVSEGIEYFRYADDVVIMAKTSDQINRATEKVALFIREYGLKFNEKTILEKLGNADGIQELKFYNPYGNLNESSHQKVLKISKKLPRIFNRIIKGKEVKQTDIGALKYYLKAGTKLGNPEVADSLISIIPKKPSLIYLISRYLGSYLSGIDDEETIHDVYNPPTKVIASRWNKILKIYSDNPLSEWTRFWLMKILVAPPFAKNEPKFLSELDKVIANSTDRFLKPLAFFYRAYLRDTIRWKKVMDGEKIDAIDLGFTADDIKRNIKNSKTESEKSVYYYFLVYLNGIEDDGVIKSLVYEALQSKSSEIQTMGIFLVKKIYRIELPELLKKYTHKMTPNELIIEMPDNREWRIDLHADKVGELGKAYFKLSSSTKEPIKTKPSELLTGDGKIAHDKLSQFFGMPNPLRVELVGDSRMTVIKEIRKNIPLPKVSSSFVGKKKMVRKAGDLAYYNDGTVHFKDGILPMRVQLRDICTLFINSPNQLITSDDIYDQLDKALNKTTISKYVSELHTLLKTKYQRSVITNDKKNGWIFRP